MGIPTTSTRGTPGGIKLGDGFQTLIAFENNLVVAFYEKTVTPPGLDGGDPVDTTTMHNATYRTKISRALIEMTDAGIVVAYDPLVLDEIVTLLNVEQSITVNHSNGDKWDFWGFLKSFVPSEVSEGAQPEATIVIVATNTDPSDGSESGPNYVSDVGTGS